MTAYQTAQPYESPLTALQHGMLLHSLSAPDDAVYVQQKVVTLRHAVVFTGVGAHTSISMLVRPGNPSDSLLRSLVYQHRRFSVYWFA